ncbi:MAG: CDP-glycerol glycerophosphotransferase family protein [Porticoccaceae bacterium]|nr:CDP-glycerol glycerophosphotransferase family protein [Porticoccaceae bacterium]
MSSVLTDMANVFFDVQELYYLPQYLPIHHELIKRGQGNTTFIFHHGKFDTVIENIIEKENLNHVWVDNKAEANKYYQTQKADWIFFSNTFPFLDEVHKVSKSVQIGHGIGPKASYYAQSDTPTTVRFVEGEYRTSRLKSMYPNNKFVDVGFCKLDSIINGDVCGFDLESLNLDSNKKTIVYAPTFYPSSLERFAKNFPEDFQEFNIMIKPHYFSLSKEKYRKQRQLLECWAKYDNVYLAKADDYSLVPFMATADLLISDTSSAIIEFAALDKPVIWCNFLKLRWTYRGIFSYRFKKRMDKDYSEYSKVAVRSDSYDSLKNNVKEQILNPKSLSDQRLHYANKMAGALDGKASQRIIDYLLENK